MSYVEKIDFFDKNYEKNDIFSDFRHIFDACSGMKPIYSVSALWNLSNEPKKLHFPPELFELFRTDEWDEFSGAKNELKMTYFRNLNILSSPVAKWNLYALLVRVIIY